MCSTSLKIMQIQINITLRFLFTPGRMTRANKNLTVNFGKDTVKGESSSTVGVFSNWCHHYGNCSG